MKIYEVASAMWETLKFPIRLIVLAVIPVLLAHFQVINTLEAQMIYAALVGLDKYMHELGKETYNDSLKTGLTRF